MGLALWFYFNEDIDADDIEDQTPEKNHRQVRGNQEENSKQTTAIDLQRALSMHWFTFSSLHTMLQEE